MRGLGCFALVALLLAGCSSATEPSTLPPATSAPAPVESTPAPSATAAPTKSDEGVEAFVNAYINTANTALGDPDAMRTWRKLFRDSCQVCLSGFLSASEVHAAGQRVEGGRLVDPTIDLRGVSPDEGTAVVSGRIQAAEVVSASGQVVESFPSIEAVTIIYTAERAQRGWVMTSGQVVQ